ncbi:MAG: acyltransferase [Verrucomicrobiota bacterium]|nr:acyltransferase [Verrucomicrobiota bacterium]
MADNSGNVKERINDPGRPALARYREAYYGDQSLAFAIRAECLMFLLGDMPGAAGIFLRSHLYRSLLGVAAGRVLIGRNVTFRHPHKIRVGRNVLIDDNVVLDAKGETNEGIALGDNVFISRNCAIYCKNGDIRFGNKVSLSANCTIMSANRITVGEGTIVGAYSHFLGGGEYDYTNRETAFYDQKPAAGKGELTIGRNCWIGTRVTVLDAASIGDHCVIGAHSLVTRPIPPNSLAYGAPARVVKTI